MRDSFEAGIKQIEAAIVQQASAIESMVLAAHRGLSERCLGTADEVLAKERQVNTAEIAIEKQCLLLIALHQPVATDLRRIAAAIKINADLERIADLALNLAERTESLAAHPAVAIPAALTDMVTFAVEMLRNANQAFQTRDVELAREVCESDAELDAMNHALIESLVEQMRHDSEEVAGYLHVFSASRIVERMGDHATNIAEDVEFVVDGEITRHGLVG